MSLYEAISILFSLVSLALSYLAYNATRRPVTVDFGTNYYLLDPKTDIISQDNSIQGVASKHALYTTITIVNPSTVNMAYMDLRAFDPKTNANHFIATKRSLPFLDNSKIFLMPFGEDALEKFFIHLPDRPFGSLPAGSYTSLDVLIFINDNVDISSGLVLSFKTSKNSFFHRSPWSDTNRKKFRAYHFTYDLSKLRQDS